MVSVNGSIESETGLKLISNILKQILRDEKCQNEAIFSVFGMKEM